MDLRAYAIPVLVAFCLFAVFGLYMPMGSMSGDMHCPYAPGGTALCGYTLAHLKHWLTAFAAVLAELLVLAALVFVSSRSNTIPTIREHHNEKYRFGQQTPERPTLFQKLFSQGILNRKEHYRF